MTANVYITLDAPPQLIPVNDTYIGQYNTPFSPPISQLIVSNDWSPSATPNLQVISVGALVEGSGNVTSFTAPGSFVFTPAANFVGRVVFPYTVRDQSNGLSGTAYVHITFLPPAAPFTMTDYHSCVCGRACVISTSVLRNDTSPTNGTLTVVGLGKPPPIGSVLIERSGVFTYNPPATNCQPGTFSFIYLVTDSNYGGGNDAVPGNVYITLTLPPAACIAAVDDYYETAFETPLTVPGAAGAAPRALLANDSSSCSAQPALRVVNHTALLVANTGNVSAVTSQGGFLYTPPAGFSGTTHFQYTIVDGTLPLSATATAYIRVRPRAAGAMNSVVSNYTYPVWSLEPFAPTNGWLLQGLTSTNANPTFSVVDIYQPPDSFAGEVTSWSADGNFVFTPLEAWQDDQTTFCANVTDGRGAYGTSCVTVYMPAPLYPELCRCAPFTGGSLFDYVTTADCEQFGFDTSFFSQSPGCPETALDEAAKPLGCWLEANWAAVVAAQGIAGETTRLVARAGDFTMNFTRGGLFCMGEWFQLDQLYLDATAYPVTKSVLVDGTPGSCGAAPDLASMGGQTLISALGVRLNVLRDTVLQGQACPSHVANLYM